MAISLSLEQRNARRAHEGVELCYGHGPLSVLMFHHHSGALFGQEQCCFDGQKVAVTTPQRKLGQMVVLAEF